MVSKQTHNILDNFQVTLKHCILIGFIYTADAYELLELYLKEEVADPSQTVGDARLGLSQPVVIRDADIVHVF